jgi:hypothetical protein
LGSASFTTFDLYDDELGVDLDQLPRLFGGWFIVRDPRAVVAGAVFAAFARPAAEAKILENARAAIPALGTGETLPDALADSGDAADGLRLDSAALVDAFVLRAVLTRPRARRF